MLSLDIQLNHQPQSRIPTRLLVESLALRLVKLQEASEEDNCRFFRSEFSLDTITGSNCFLLAPTFFFGHRLHVLSVALFSCVQVGNWVISIFQSTSCMNYVVTVLSF
jgi:hypothetical protein